MIGSAEEFAHLRRSNLGADQERAASDELPEPVCRDVMDRFPDLRLWLARNRTVPVAILRVLATEPRRLSAAPSPSTMLSNRNS
jgi:hypothetical protein